MENFFFCAVSCVNSLCKSFDDFVLGYKGYYYVYKKFNNVAGNWLSWLNWLKWWLIRRIMGQHFFICLNSEK